MYVKPFGYARADSVEDAVGLLREYGSAAKLLAGGQSLMPLINLGLAQVDLVVDVSHIPGLDSVRRENGFLKIGAMVKHGVLETSGTVRSAQPLLSAAILHVGNPRVRNRGTLGGSLAHGDPAAEVPLVMCVLEAEYEASDGSKPRQISAHDFAVTFYTTDLSDTELLLSASVPVLEDGWGWGFHEVSRRAGDFALVAAAAIVRCRDGIIEDVRLGLAAVADRAVRCRTFEESARGASTNMVGSLAEAIRADITPPADVNASSEYRARVAVALGTRAVEDACRRSEGAMG